MCREIVDNVLSGTKAGFKSILNIFKLSNGESRMFNQKGSSTLSATPAGSHPGSKRLLGWPGLGSQVCDGPHQRQGSDRSGIRRDIHLCHE